MNLKLFFLLFLPILFSSQSLDSDRVIISYERLLGPSYGSGVIGSTTNKAFASLVTENFEEKQPLIFKEIKFATTNYNKQKGSVYLCIYENNNGLPGEIVPRSRILIDVPSKKTLIKVNISKLKVTVPNKNYFIGFEWIPTKENTIYGAQSSFKKPYTPAIDGTLQSEHNLFVFSTGWKKAEDQLVSQLSVEVNYIPAEQ